MSKSEVNRRTLALLAERLGTHEREAVTFVREGGPLKIAMLLNELQTTTADGPLEQLILAMAELGLLHALRLHLSDTAAVPQPSNN